MWFCTLFNPFIVADVISHYTNTAEALFRHDDNSKVLYISGELRLQLNGRLSSQLIHRENSCVDMRRSTDLAIIVALSKHQSHFFVDLENDILPIPWTCPSLETGDCVAFNANTCTYFSGSVRGMKDEMLMVVSTIVLHFKVLPVHPDLTALLKANSPPELEIPEHTLMFGFHQPPVLRCVCCRYPITNRVSLQACRRCCLQPPIAFQNIQRFGDLSCVICDMCTILPVDQTSLEALSATRSCDPKNTLLDYMWNSIVYDPTTPHTTCIHPLTERVRLDPTSGVLLYYSVQELLKSCAWLMRVLLANVLVSNTLIESCQDLVSFALVAGGGCQRASSLAALMLRVVGIHDFSKATVDSASLLQPQLDRAYTKMTLARLGIVAKLVTGLRLASPDVATFTTGLFEMMVTASITGVRLVTSCDLKCEGASPAGFVQCWPKFTIFQSNGTSETYDEFLRKLASKIPRHIWVMHESFS